MYRIAGKFGGKLCKFGGWLSKLESANNIMLMNVAGAKYVVT